MRDPVLVLLAVACLGQAVASAALWRMWLTERRRRYDAEAAARRKYLVAHLAARQLVSRLIAGWTYRPR